MRPSRPGFVSVSLLLAACSSGVEATNPYDPASTSPAPGAIAGRVVAPGRASAGGIRLFLEDGSSGVAEADTGADGSFLLSGVSPGRYGLAIREEGFYPARLYPVDVALGATVDVGEIPLQSLASGTDASVIAGKALFDGRTDHSGIVVEALDTTFRAITGSDGSYALTVAEGSHDLQFSAREWAPVSRAGVTVARGETLELEPVTLTQAPATITGLVRWRSCTHDPADELERLAAGALVSVVGTGATAVTDSEGQFQLTGLPGGTFTVRAALDGQDARDSLPVTVEPGGVAAIPEPLVLPASRGAVVGQVFLTGRVDHSGTLVQLSGVPGFDSVTVVDGAFRIERVCAGEGYELRARAGQEGFLPGIAGGITVVSAADSLPVELTLAPQQGGLVLAGGAEAVRDPLVSFALAAPAGTTEMRLAFAEFTDDLGWEPYRDSGTLALAGGDGSHSVFAQLRTGAAVSAIFRDGVVLDRLPPAAASVVIEGGGAYSNDPDGAVTLTLTASDAAVAPVDRTSGLAAMKLLDHDPLGGAPAPDDPADPVWDDPALVPVLPYQRSLDHPLLRPNVDEEKELWVRFGDAAGNWSDPVSARVVLDREAPDGTAVEIVTSTPGFTGDSRVDLLLTASDENPGLQVRISGSSTFVGAVLQPVPAPPTVSWNLPQVDGPQTVWVQYADVAGNLGPPLSASIELDRLPPTGVRLTVDQAPYAAARSVALTLAAQGAVEMVFSLQPDFTDAAGSPEAWVPFAGTFAATLAAGDGPQVIYGKFRDAAHNESVTLAAGVTLDTVAPVLSAVQVLEGDAVRAPAITVAVTALPGPLDAYELRVDVQDAPPGGAVTTGAWQPFNPAVPVTLLAPDGEKELQLRLRDAAGNVSAFPGTARVVLDTVAPSLLAVELAGGAAWASDASVPLTVDATGADQILISNRGDFAGSAWQPFTDPNLTWTLPAVGGPHTVFVRVRDLAGNEAAGSAQIGLDLTGPQPVAVTIDGGATYSRDLTVDLLLFATDALSGVAFADVANDPGYSGAQRVAWAGGGSQPLPGFSLLPGDGPHTVFVRYADLAGNLVQATATVVVDSAPPAGSLLIEGGAAYTQAAGVTVSFTAPADTTELKLVDGAVPSCAAPLSPYLATVPHTLPAGDGSKSLSVCFVDAAGNTATATASIRLDTQNPTGTASLDGGALYTTDEDVTLRLTASADVSLVALANAASLDCTTASYEPLVGQRSWPLSPGNGPKNVAVCFKDAAGRTGSTSAAITLDGAAPVVSLVVAAGATYSAVATVAVELSFSNDVNGYSVRNGTLDCATATYTAVAVGSVTASLPAHALAPLQGAQTVFGCVRDVAGNFSQASDSIVFDSEAPTSQQVSLAPSGVINTTSVTATLSASGAVELCLYGDLVGGSNDSCVANGWVALAPTAALTLTGADGTKQVNAHFRDAAGNVGPRAAAAVLLDRTLPAVAGFTLTGLGKDGPSTVVTRSQTVLADLTGWSDGSGPGIDAIQLSENGAFAGAAWQPAGTSVPFALSGGDAAKTVFGRARDRAGNVSVAVSGTISLDQTAPAGGALAIASGAAYTNAPFPHTVPVTFFIGGGAVQWSPDGSAWTDCSPSPCASAAPGESIDRDLPTGDGPKQLSLHFRDDAGNLSAPLSAGIILDTELPSTAALRSVAPRSTSLFVDLDEATDNFEVARYEVEITDGLGGTSLHPFAVSEGWITDLPGLAAYDLRARAVDSAGNVSAWLPAGTPADPAATAMLGLGASTVDAVGVGSRGSRAVATGGQTFLASISGGSFRLVTCDARQAPCADTLVASELDPTGTGLPLSHVSLVVQGQSLWLFGIRAMGGAIYQVEALTTRNLETAWDLATWSWSDLGNTPGRALSFAAASNGKVVALSHANTSNLIFTTVCPLDGACTTAAEWSPWLQVFVNAGADRAVTYHSGSLSMDAGENHLWISYPSSNAGGACSSGSSTCGLAVLGCAISESPTRCTAAADWNKVKLIHPDGGRAVAERIVEAEGYLWVAGLLETPAASLAPEGLWLWRCAVTQSPTGDLCATAATFGSPALLRPLSRLTGGVAGEPSSQVAFEPWAGSLFFAAQDYGDLSVTFGRCNQAQADCMAQAGGELVNFSRGTVLNAASDAGEPKLVLNQGNPAVFLERDSSRAYVLEPHTAAPLQRALVPDLVTRGVRASWLDRDSSATDGYAVLYEQPVRTQPDFDQQLTSFSPTDTALPVSSSSGVDHFGTVTALRGQDRSAAEPVFLARGGTRLERAAVADSSGEPHYARSPGCHAVFWVGLGNQLTLSTCARSSGCDEEADWSDLPIGIPLFGYSDYAMALDPAGTRVHLAAAYSLEPQDLRYWWRALDPVTCVADPTNHELELLDGAGVPVPDVNPRALSLAATASRVFLAYSRDRVLTRTASNMSLASCDVASGCTAPGNWATAAFDNHYEGGALAVTASELLWVNQWNDGILTSPNRTQLWHCPLASLCDAAGDFVGQHTVFTSRVGGTAGRKDFIGLRHEEGRLLLSWGDELAWCNEAPASCDAPEAWNRGWFSPDLLNHTAQQITLLGSVGNVGGAIGDLAYLGLGNDGHSMARCTGRCWLPDSFLGGYIQHDGATAGSLGQSQYGSPGTFDAGAATFVVRDYDAGPNQRHWVFHEGPFLDVSQ